MTNEIAERAARGCLVKQVEFCGLVGRDHPVRDLLEAGLPVNVRQDRRIQHDARVPGQNAGSYSVYTITQGGVYHEVPSRLAKKAPFG